MSAERMELLLNRLSYTQEDEVELELTAVEMSAAAKAEGYDPATEMHEFMASWILPTATAWQSKEILKRHRKA
jgi:hypothetical protein